MARFRDLVGDRFGKWVVLAWHSKKYSQQFWTCKCDCGTVKVVIGDSLKKGLSKSCGCAGKDWCWKHGMEGSSTYSIWAGMIQRCHNERAREFPRYGGRGVKVCARWREDFRNFLSDMGERPDGKSIDRIDNNGDYEPSNCRWATSKQQSRNKAKTMYLDHDGVRLPVAEWAERIGLKRKILERRLRDGWSVEKALSPKLFSRWGERG